MSRLIDPQTAQHLERTTRNAAEAGCRQIEKQKTAEAQAAKGIKLVEVQEKK